MNEAVVPERAILMASVVPFLYTYRAKIRRFPLIPFLKDAGLRLTSIRLACGPRGISAAIFSFRVIGFGLTMHGFALTVCGFSLTMWSVRSLALSITNCLPANVSPAQEPRSRSSL
jgi:hypothetical protein